MVTATETNEVTIVTLGSLVDALGTLTSSPVDRAARGVEITAVAVDSRRVQGGELFVAVTGTAVDGHDFVADAIARGAVAVIAERDVATGGRPLVKVADSSKAIALVASRFFGDPSSDLRLCGITGTNGKTSTSHLVRSILTTGGRKVGIIGTLGHGVERLERDPHTTPDALTLHSWFARMRDQHCFGVVMEVSSHAVRQHRVWGLEFEVGILTNVTHDHLDFHKSMSDYKAAKAEFVNSLAAAGRTKPAGTLVYWIDDPNAREIGGAFRGRRIAVGTSTDADWRVHRIDVSLEATRFSLAVKDGDDIDVSMKLLGGFVPANAALAAAAAATMGATPEQVRAGLEAIDRVPGRFEALGGAGKPVVVIDYAHTPDGFEGALDTCRGLNPKRITTVFGCGGDRDRAKRPVMGGIVERMSDRCIITTDNPRSERVETIVADILSGMKRPDVAVVELDRARAVFDAIASSTAGDVVALLGKGHEDYQIIGSDRITYSDRAVAEEALARWPAR
jgi:UDP-N-acetylmuramoyl-L-alanyl-D-glutamate--2,6-diaminopimelate ligase